MEKKEQENLKTEFLAVTATPEEKRTWEAAAKADSRTPAAWARKALNEKAKEEKL